MFLADEFHHVSADANSGLVDIVHRMMTRGSYFLLDGILVYLAEVLDQSRDRKGRLMGRSICIFENGTVSDVKLNTLRKALYKNGYAIRENNDTTSEYLNHQFNVATHG